MKRRFIILCREDCPYCSEAIELLRSREEDVSVINFEYDQQQDKILLEIKEAYNHFTVPIIFQRHGNDVKFIGGCSDLKEFLDEDE